jgi:DNA-directed RNA polymerase specialized sigma24 family protein
MEDVAIAPLDAASSSPLAGPDAEPQPGPLAVQRSPEQAEQLVLDLIAAHADSLLRTARRYSLCADDAQDAYQRGLEILMRHAGRLDADRAAGWLHTVVNRHNDTWRRRPARVRRAASHEGHRGAGSTCRRRRRACAYTRKR